MDPLYNVCVIFDNDICKVCKDYIFRNVETLKDAREPILGITAILICSLLWNTGMIGHTPGIINWLWVFIYVLAYLGIEHIITENWRGKIIKEYTADYGNIKNVCKYDHYLFIELPEDRYFPYILPVDKQKAGKGLTKELMTLKKKQYLYQR